MTEENQLEQNQREKPMSFITMVILTGLFGGIFWSGLAYFAYVFNLTEIRPTVILEPWTIGDWKVGWLGTVVSIVLIGVISIVVALIYYVALRKFPSIFVGIGYGIVLFLLVFFVLNPIFPGISPFNELERNTIITSVCFYILYGVFIGYSISYEESELKYKAMKERKGQQDVNNA
ncbi:high-affinity Fe2+/Pb2+ permease [Cytobacillus eiseniae]|uniref:High-affinity Fe2+/Pb2+ permease n=1 Tax=Cytobacillus eiseniae TaxID=762947 RepID=A0ABS4REQ9_9BACI|nr:YqhR family membrane protein [Cytobacillus eiseniae]MBP2240840.1 high-affinity Fe2+/Pb2+ permease [Cytobacillus eiseniae]